MTVTTLSTLFSAVEKTPKRLEMQALLAQFFAQASAEEGAISAYLLIGRIVPEFIPVEFQLSDKSLRAVVEEITQKDISEELQRLGDIGSVWQELAPDKPDTISVAELYDFLWKIARISGTGSQKAKQNAVQELLAKVSGQTGRYVIRILNSKLRLGASERTMLDALGTLEGGDATKLRDLFGKTSDIGHTVFLFKTYGANCYDKTSFVPGVPVSAKLVEREDSIDDIFKRIPDPYEEPKYDGLRIQIHVYKQALLAEIYKDRVWQKQYEEVVAPEIEPQTSLFDQTTPLPESEWQVRLFSRNLEDMTSMFPEVVVAAQRLPEQFEKKHGTEIASLVLDGEVIGYNDLVEEYLPFQQTMTRKRKYEVGSAADEVPVKVFSFDILLVNGESLMTKPLSERKGLLSFLDEHKELQTTIVQTPKHEPATIEEATKLFETYVAEGLEGVIFKDKSSVYTPGVRNFDWLKFKRAMKSDLADTLDVVLLGYYRGEGKLAVFGIGALLAAVYDRDADKYVTVTKIGTGITHEQWQTIKKACDAVKTDRELDTVVVPKSLKPDVWLIPSLVVEVECDEITKSPLHTSGYALRFPRFKKFREKRADQATTVEEVAVLAG